MSVIWGRMLFRSMFFVFYLLICLISAQGIANTTSPIHNLSLDKLSVEQGLSQGTVNALLQDSTGYIWLGTETGVDIYDGHNIRHVLGPDGDFAQFSVYNLMEDSQGLIWINLYGKGLYTYAPQTDQYQLVLTTDPENADNYIVDVVEGKEDTFWIATAKNVGLYSKSTQSFAKQIDLSAELIKVNNIYKIFLKNDVLYIATRVGVFAYHTVEKQLKKLPDLPLSSHHNATEISKVYTLYVNEHQQLYVGTYSTVFTVDVSNINSFLAGKNTYLSAQPVLENTSTWGFLPQAHQLYVASDKGLSVIDMNTNVSTHLFGLSDAENHVVANQIISLIVDKQGFFWLGSNATGVYRWNPKHELIKNVSYNKGDNASLSNNEVWSITPHKKDKNAVWVATANGLNLVNILTGHVERFMVTDDTKNLYNKSHFYVVNADSSQRLWLLGAKGVVLFDSVNKQELALPFSAETNKLLLNENIIDIELDVQENLWVIGEKDYFKISLVTGEVELLPELKSVIQIENASSLLGFLPDSNKLVVSSYNGLWAYDTALKETSLMYQLPNVLETEMVSSDSWVIDKNNILWIGLAGKGLVGISLETNERKYFFNKSNSIIDDNVYGVMLDNDGDVWFSTHTGLYMLNVESQHIRHFTTDDGLPAMEFNSSAFANLPNNLFAYGSMRGTSYFDPIILKSANITHDFNVHVTQVNVLSRELNMPIVVNERVPLHFNYDDVGIRFDFSTLSFGDKGKAIYEYALTGKNNITYPPTTKSDITFASLASGKYTLSIKAKSPVTGQYSPEKKLTIYVSYAPWASPVAYLIYSIIVFLVLTFWYLRKAKQNQQLRYAHEQVKYRENRLQLALTGSNSEVWDWQADDNLMFGKRIVDELGYPQYGESYTFTDHVKLIHPDDKTTFLAHWQAYIKNPSEQENFACTYRLKSANDDWLWYKDLGKAVEFTDNEPTRITGSYTNITESRAAEERAQYYGDAFKQTTDWVLIISENFERMTANQSLRDVFGWQDEELRFDSSLLGLSRERRNFYRRLLLSLKEGEHWRGEDLILTKEGEEYHVILNINVCRNRTNNSLHYLCVFTDITAQKAAENELRYLANYDHLTELPNRSLLLERIKHAMDYSVRKSKSIALFFIDLDRFKQVNDSLGHEYGDMLLQEVTKRLTSVLRIDDTVARIGGDEFVVLLESYRSSSQLAQIAQKIIDVVEKPVELKDSQVSIGASIGIALFPEDAKDSGELLRNADVAMYHAKQIGRNTYQFFTERMNYEAGMRLQTESNLKIAHANKEFINHYQPIVDSYTGKAVGAELLLRWQTKEGLIPPMEFIPVAEELNMIIAMTEDALERGLADLAIWQKLRPSYYLSVNISAQHFIKPSLVTYINGLLKKYQIAASCLKFEITESILISEPKKVINTMKSLKKLGVKLALDDFGTGYSSLNYLKQLPLDILKIDRSFVSGIGVEKMDEAIVDATLVLAKRLGMECIGEGVETQEQLTYLSEKHCHFIQGYLYSKPVDAKAIEQALIADTVEITSVPLQ